MRIYKPRQFNELWTKFLEILNTMNGFDNGKTSKQLAQIIFEDDDKRFVKIIYYWICVVRNDKYEYRIPIWSFRLPRTKRKIYYLPLNWHDFNEVKNDCARRKHLSDFYMALHQKRANELGVKIDMVVKKEVRR